MHVVKTVQQLEEAIRENAKGIMIVGRKAPEILENLRPSTSNEYRNLMYSFFYRVNGGFNILEIIDINHKTHTFCIRNPIRTDDRYLARLNEWPRILRFSGYDDYERLKGEVSKILAEVTGQPHSLQEVAVNEALMDAMECQDGMPKQQTAQLRFNKIGNRLIVRVKISCMRFAGNAILRRLRSQREDPFRFSEDSAIERGIPVMLATTHRMIYNSERTEVLLAWKLDS